MQNNRLYAGDTCITPFSNLGGRGYQNVIFLEQNEISIMWTRWLVTFSINLAPYNRASRFLKESISNVQSGAKKDFPQEFLEDETFETLLKT